MADDNPYVPPVTDANQNGPSQHLPAAAQSSFLFLAGRTNAGKGNGPGRLLLTQNSLFAFRYEPIGIMLFGPLLGILGYFFGKLLDSVIEKWKKVPTHMEDPEIALLTGTTKKEIRNAKLLARLPLDSSLRIQKTALGYKFSNDETVVTFQGLIHKGKIDRFLTKKGLQTL